MDRVLKKTVTLAERRQTAKTGPPPEAKSLIPSAALMGVGLLLESELLVGVALGMGLVIASRWLPQDLAETVQPIVNSAVESCYSAARKTSEMLGEAAQRVESIVTRQASRKRRPQLAKPRARLRRIGPSSEEARPQA